MSLDSIINAVDTPVDVKSLRDRAVHADTTVPTDRVVEEVPSIIATDTIGGDSLLTVPAAPVSSSSRMRYVKTDLDAAVDFASTDSMLIIGRDSAFMYGKSIVNYGNISLEAAIIRMNLRDNTVFAVGRTDSSGTVEGKPVFLENGTQYEAASMRYNFKTEKGYIQNVVTQQGEGYLTGGTTKRHRKRILHQRRPLHHLRPSR